MRTSSLPNLTLRSIICLLAGATFLACGRKGDPIPRTRAVPAACVARWASHRVLEVRLPTLDARGEELGGIEKVRVFYLPLGSSRPTGQAVLAAGEVVLERARPDLAGPGGLVRLDMSQVGRPSGWIVAAAIRVGNGVGAPSEPLPWLDPAF